MRGYNMPTLIVENVPAEVYERLMKRAVAGQRTLPEETLHLLKQVLHEEDIPAPRLPDFIPNKEVSAPCDLPRSSQPVPVVAYRGQPRLPDPLTDTAPAPYETELLCPTPLIDLASGGCESPGTSPRQGFDK